MSIVEKIALAGVVGCGGAGFPTDLKLGGKFEYFIVNAAECEPVLQHDKYIMRHYASEIVDTLDAIKKETGAESCIIALKKSYTEEISALRNAITRSGSDVTICEMDSFYPAGDEQAMVYEAIGKIVPPGAIPASVGAVVDNVATVLEIGNALKDKKVTHKFMTVSGAVGKPSILYVPIGTSMTQCLEMCGGAACRSFTAVLGGPMMGRYVSPEELKECFVTKTSSGIIVLPDEDYNMPAPDIRRMINRARSACIQCTSCTQLCPRHMLGHPLEPHKIMRHLSTYGDIESAVNDPFIQSAQMCCECGVCEKYACPMGLQPRTINSLIRREMGKQGIRYKAPDRQYEADEERENRKVPTSRLAMRLGVYKYHHLTLDELISFTPDEVRIPTRMHIGPAAEPVVSVGQHVMEGELIAKRPAPGKGANIYASIEGTVTSVGDTIVITAGKR